MSHCRIIGTIPNWCISEDVTTSLNCIITSLYLSHRCWIKICTSSNGKKSTNTLAKTRPQNGVQLSMNPLSMNFLALDSWSHFMACEVSKSTITYLKVLLSKIFCLMTNKMCVVIPNECCFMSSKAAPKPHGCPDSQTPSSPNSSRPPPPLSIQTSGRSLTVHFIA